MTRWHALLLTALVATAVHTIAGEKDEIHFATANVNYRAGFEKIVENYNQLHSDREVKLTLVPENFGIWIETKFSGGLASAPDIYNGETTPSYGIQGKWVCLDPFLAQVNPYTERPWHETVDMSLLRHYDISGKIYAMSLDRVEIGIVYNREIFDELGLEVPQTWQDLMATCETIDQAGYIPFAIPGNLNSFYHGVINWIARFFSDAYCRDLLSVTMSQPGDWDYDPVENGGFTMDMNDIHNDAEVVINQERKLLMIRDRTVRFDSERFKAMYRQLRTFSSYWQPGYAGTDRDMAFQLFLKKKAAMYFDGSHIPIALEMNMQGLREEDRFDFRIMPIPPLTNDPECRGPFRGVGGCGTYYTVTDKSSLTPDDDRHTRNVLDFLMFLASPESAQVLVDETLKSKQPIIGPIAIKGVTLPPDIADKFTPYEGRGYVKADLVGLEGDKEGMYDWAVLSQEFFAGRIAEDTFLKEYQAIMDRSLTRVAEKLQTDWDPQTRDEVKFVPAPPKVWWNPLANGLVMAVVLALTFLVFALGAHYRSKRRFGADYTPVAFYLLIPTFTMLILFNYYPAISGLYHAFTEWEGGNPATFNGLDNFRKMLDDVYLFAGLKNMLILVVCAVIKATVVPFLVAEMLFCLRSPKLKAFFRGAFLIPMVVPGIVMILIWKFVYDPNSGLLNSVLELAGMPGLQRSWLGDPGTALPSLIMIGFPWVGAIGMLIYLAGLQTISTSMFEAHRLESDSIWSRIRHIDIPLVGAQTKLLVILALIQTLQDFFTMLILTDGGPGMATMVPALRMYYAAFQFSHFGYAAAVGVVLFILILIITFINMKLWKTENSCE